MKIKINISNTTVRKQAILEADKKEAYNCNDIICCNNCECIDCIFNGQGLTQVEISNRVIED